MKAPAITLKCDCGAEGSATYGQRWTCDACGRTYDTSHIPEDEYRAIEALGRRYRLVGWTLMAVLALLVLAVALTQQLIPIFAGLAVVLLTWFLYIKPLVHRSHKRAVRGLTRNWNLQAEGPET